MAEEATIPGSTPSGHDAVKAVAEKGKDATAAEKSAALDWFLDPDPEDVAYNTIELNVGGPEGSDTERWVTFRVQVLDRERIREIRKQSERRQPDGSREIDEMEANARIAAEGLLDPDLSKPQNRVVRGQQHLDPADALSARFSHKPGLIDQIAGKVIEFSGYNDADVREVKAAGN